LAWLELLLQALIGLFGLRGLAEDFSDTHGPYLQFRRLDSDG
jgi:hypothetical protein